jgi:hypothetical protein
VENKPNRVRKTTTTAFVCVLIMVYALAPRTQPTTDLVIYEHPPKHLIEDPDQDAGLNQHQLEIEKVPAFKPTAEEYARSYTDGFDEWECLYELWWHESKWDYTAEGPTNDWGIPQANADAHPETAQSRWRADKYKQVRWGVEYIKTRYGSFCDAWDAWKSRATLRQDGTWHGGWY